MQPSLDSLCRQRDRLRSFGDGSAAARRMPIRQRQP